MDGISLPDGSKFAVSTAEERPDLWLEARASLRAVWPEYNLHGDVSGRYFDALFPDYANVQVTVRDTESERVVACGQAIPFRWDGTLDDLPAGIDAMGLRALDDPSLPTTLSALAVEVAEDQRNQGLSRLVLLAMAQAARLAGLAPLLAPVRPNWKERYPLIPIEQYCRWTRKDALPFDPWMRVHARLGACILRPEPRSFRVTASVEEWERWTGMLYPDDGMYVFPEGLSPLTVAGGIGRYWEPNVWMIHSTE